MVQDRAIFTNYNGGPIESRVCSIERRHFQWPWTTPTPGFKVTPFFDSKKYIRNGTRYRRSFNEILIGTCTRPTRQRHFEWAWLTLSDLAKYLMTRSVARSLCDSLTVSVLITVHLQSLLIVATAELLVFIRQHSMMLAKVTKQSHVCLMLMKAFYHKLHWTDSSSLT